MDILHHFPIRSRCNLFFLIWRCRVCHYLIWLGPDCILSKILPLKLDVILSKKLLEKSKYNDCESVKNISHSQASLPKRKRKEMRCFELLSFKSLLNLIPVCKKFKGLYSMVLIQLLSLTHRHSLEERETSVREAMLKKRPYFVRPVPKHFNHCCHLLVLEQTVQVVSWELINHLASVVEIVFTHILDDEGAWNGFKQIYSYFL